MVHHLLMQFTQTQVTLFYLKSKLFYIYLQIGELIVINVLTNLHYTGIVIKCITSDHCL